MPRVDYEQHGRTYALLPTETEQLIVRRLQEALRCGDWDERYGYLRGQASYSGALRLVISHPR